MPEYLRELPEEQFWELYQPHIEPLSPNDCTPKHLYWGEGRSIGELGICIGEDTMGDMLFEGLTNNGTVDHLFVERYNIGKGTFKPYVDMGEVPTMRSNDEIMAWILGQTIDMFQAKQDWLRGLPSNLKETKGYEYISSDTRSALSLYKTIQETGFRKAPMLGY